MIRNVNAAAPTPAWMRQRLERAGQRSISALVDVTNYVMLELGRPLHVYDQDKLHGRDRRALGPRGREAAAAERRRKSRSMPAVLCITDDSGPIGLAGIMGGESTKAETGTQNMFLESAFFFPEAIAGRARRYNFTSDAAHRFERGVDFDNNVEGIERATQLILEICGGEPGPDGGPGQAPAEAKAGAHARRARAEGHRHRVDCEGNRQRFSSASALPFSARQGQLHGDPALATASTSRSRKT